MASSFINAIIDFSERADVDIQELRKNVQKEFVASIIGDTPVDSGLARRNWQAAKGAIPTGIVPYAGSPSGAGAQAISAAQATAFGEDGVWYFVNNLPYIYRLEMGWSRQAPSGMARTNAQRIIANLRG